MLTMLFEQVLVRFSYLIGRSDVYIVHAKAKIQKRRLDLLKGLFIVEASDLWSQTPTR